MTNFELPFVDAQRGRDGMVKYWYFRRNGRRWRLPGTPLSEEFMREYRRLVVKTDASSHPQSGKSPHGPGSFGTLVRDYFASGEFKQLKERTKAEYRRVCGGVTSER